MQPRRPRHLNSARQRWTAIGPAALARAAATLPGRTPRPRLPIHRVSPWLRLWGPPVPEGDSQATSGASTREEALPAAGLSPKRLPRAKKTPRISPRRFSFIECFDLLGDGLLEHAVHLLVRSVAAGLARLSRLQSLVRSALGTISGRTRGLRGARCRVGGG